MEAGKITLRIKLVNIITLIEEVVDSQILVAKAKGLNLVVNTGEDIPFVALDRDRIMQVLINLLSNAIKFTDRGGITVQITSPEPKDTVEVRISDTGPGISPEDLAKLFEKFVQLDGSVNNKSGGTGLGLAICKSIVECHGGRAWAESEVGKGTTMCFTLPVEEKPKGAV
jgi:signal transduction histidine kinase